MDVGQELALAFGGSRIHQGVRLADFDGVHGPSLRDGRRCFAPDAGERGLNFSSKRAISSWLAVTSACSASISATMASWKSKSGWGDNALFMQHTKPDPSAFLPRHGKALDCCCFSGSCALTQKAARPCRDQIPAPVTVAQHSHTQKGCIIHMTSSSNLQLSSGHRLSLCYRLSIRASLAWSRPQPVPVADVIFKWRNHHE